MTLTVLFMLSILALGGPIRPREPKGTVVCLHGILNTRARMAPAALLLRARGWEVVNWGYPSWRRPIADHGAELAEDLAGIAERHPGRPVSFVAFSLGGLVLQAGLNHPACPAEARRGRIVMLGVPVRGAALGRRLGAWAPVRFLAGRGAGRELTETSRDGFARLGALPAEADILSLAGDLGWNPLLEGGDHDGKVEVEEARVEGRPLERVRSPHWGMAWHPGVLKRAADFLEAGR